MQAYAVVMMMFRQEEHWGVWDAALTVVKGMVSLRLVQLQQHLLGQSVHCLCTHAVSHP